MSLNEDLLVGEQAGADAIAPTGPCQWPFDPTCCSVTGTGADGCTVDKMVDVATEILWALSGRQFGLCAVTLRPCRRECFPLSYGTMTWLERFEQWPFPYFSGGQWLNLGCGGCRGDCGCSHVSEVVLPGPVETVTNVTIDGVPLLPSAWRLDDGRLLVRQDGHEWPLCQDLSKPAGAKGSWTVEAVYGTPVTPLGQTALAELTCELVKLCSGSKDCALPKNLISLVRQGLSQNFIDPQMFLKAEQLGLYFCDRFINTYNPTHARSRSQVFSPDIPRHRRTW